MTLALLSTVPLYAKRDFYAFDNGLTRTKSPPGQAKVLKGLGYDGICTRSGECTHALLSAFEKGGVKIGATFLMHSAASNPFLLCSAGARSGETLSPARKAGGAQDQTSFPGYGLYRRSGFTMRSIESGDWTSSGPPC